PLVPYNEVDPTLRATPMNPAAPARPPRPVRQPLPIDPWFARLPGGHGLLLALAREPWDDLLRLALADWLEEHGEVARAECLRLHTQLRRNPFQTGLATLTAQVATLEGEYGQAWLQGLPQGAFLVGGLAVGFRVRGESWEEDLERACQALDVQVLDL